VDKKMNPRMKNALLVVIRLASFFRLFPNRLIVLRMGPSKLIEFDEVVRSAELKPDDSVLDIGCGSGQQTLLLARRCKHVVGVDLSNESIERATILANASRLSNKVKFIQGDVAEADFGPGSFTRIVSFCVLEHIPDWQRVLRKAHGWLAPDGYLAISVDSLSSIKDETIVKKHKQDHSVALYFDKQTLEKGLKDAGFSCLELRPILTSDYARKMFERSVASENQGGYNVLRSHVLYSQLRRAERNTANKDGGIFLVAKAQPRQTANR